MPWLPAERSRDLTALSERVRSSFLGRCVLRFVLIQGFDRCIVISAQTFTALIPLFIVVASAAPAGQEDVISQAIIDRFALSGESAAAVEQLFTTPPDATSETTIFSALLLIYSGIAFTRGMQRMYRAAWGQDKAGIRSALFASLGLAALLLEVVVAYWIRAFVSRFPLEWLWAIPLSAAIGFVLWTSIPYLLLERQVHWRRLLAAGATSSLGMTLFAFATPIYIPQLMTRATTEFGLFGVTITIVGWLLAAAGILVAAAVIGAEFDASDARWLMGVKNRFALVDPDRAVDEVDEVDDVDEVSEVDDVTVTNRQGLTSADLLALVRVLVNWLIMAGAVWIATAVVPGIDVNGGVATYLFVSLLFGMINALLGPVLTWLAGSQSWLRLGGSALLVNGILFALTAGVSPNLDIAGLGSAVLGALVVAVAGTLLELVVRPVPPP